MTNREPFFDAEPSSAPIVAPPDEPILPRASPTSRPRATAPSDTPGSGADNATPSDANPFTSWRYALACSSVLGFVIAVAKLMLVPTPHEPEAAAPGEPPAMASVASPMPAAMPANTASAGNGVVAWLWSAATTPLADTMAPSDLMARKFVAGPALSDFGVTLGEFVGAFETFMQPLFETLEAGRFILRMTGTDPLTRQSYEYAFRFTAVAGPEAFGPNRLIEFTGPAVIYETLAFNREIVAADEAAALVVYLRDRALRRRR